MSGPYAKLSTPTEDLDFSTDHHDSGAGAEVSGKIGATTPLAPSSTGPSGNTSSSAAGGAGGGQSTPVNTLDEPVQETIMRDLRNIWSKILQVLDPRPNNKQNVLKDWDWWGPLLLCLALSLRLSLAAAGSSSTSDESGNLFATTFVVIWFGAAVVTLNSQLLGGKISFFQSVCVLGYCIFPLVAVSYICLIIPITFIKFILVGVAYVWATYASMNFLAEVNLEKKKLLAVYPIFLFYFAIAWIILITVVL